MKKHLLVAGLATAAIAASVSTQAGNGTIDAATMTVTVYKFAVAHGADCANPTVVFSDDAGVASDLLTGPTFGSGQVDAGTYECVIIELSKIIRTSAATTSGACTAGLEFSDVICSDGQSSALLDGTAVTCSGGAANPQHVTVFVTTASAGLGGDRALLPPANGADTTSGLKLDAPLVVTGDEPVTLSVDPVQFLDGRGGACTTSAPDFAVD